MLARPESASELACCCMDAMMLVVFDLTKPVALDVLVNLSGLDVIVAVDLADFFELFTLLLVILLLLLLLELALFVLLFELLFVALLIELGLGVSESMLYLELSFMVDTLELSLDNGIEYVYLFSGCELLIDRCLAFGERGVVGDSPPTAPVADPLVFPLLLLLPPPLKLKLKLNFFSKYFNKR